MNRSFYDSPFALLPKIKVNRNLLFGLLIIGALLAFEIFNFSTTDYSLGDLLGELNFVGLKWSTILAIAFCGIDFAGLARLFTPEVDQDEPKEVWYLFGAWLLAATMNAMLTWWGVSVAILNHTPSNNTLIDRETIVTVVPVFVAVMVWLIRVLIIGTFSVAGDRLLHEPRRSRSNNSYQRTASQSSSQPVQSIQSAPIRAATPANSPNRNVPQPVFRAAPKPISPAAASTNSRPEPTYVPLSMSPAGRDGDDFHIVP